MKRRPLVANRFYPEDPFFLLNAVKELVPQAGHKEKVIAAVSPHAGYVYSGATAGETLGSIIIPEDVIILGPNHHGRGAPIALMAEGIWEMPMGDVPINSKLGKLVLAASPLITDDEIAHRFEHSLEVQVPFLQYLQKNLAITPIVISRISFAECQEVGQALAEAIKQYAKPVLILASSDMTHYESRESAGRKDRLAIERIIDLDPRGLYDTVLGRGITMCGVIPTTIALIAAQILGATKAKLVRYTDSGEAVGTTDKVVGYAGITIS